MKGLLSVVLFAVLPVSAAQAQNGYVPVRANQATKTFWRFSNCMVELKPAAVARALNAPDWKDDQSRFAERVVTASNNCALMPGDRLTANENLFRGALAGALFVKRHRSQPLPSYEAVPQVFDEVAITAAPEDKKMRFALLAFSECVFRSNSQGVRSLLETEPVTEVESRAFGELTSLFDGCLPAREGQEMRFTRTALRGLLGEAAYAVDSGQGRQQAIAPEATK